MEQARDLGNDRVGGARSDDEIRLRDIWNLLVRNWHVIALCLLLVVGATAAYSWYVVPVFEATTSIRIEEQQPGEIPVLDLQDLSIPSEVETEMEVVRSRTLAEDVVDSLGLQVQVEEPRGVARAVLLRGIYVERWAPEGVYVLHRQPDGSYSIIEKETGASFGRVAKGKAAAVSGVTFQITDSASNYGEIVVAVSRFDDAVQDLQDHIVVVRPNSQANIISVSYQSADTQLVHDVPDRLAGYFIAQGKTYKKTEARSTVRFLEQQLDTLSGQLNAAEAAVTAFKEGQQVVSLQAEADAQVTQLANLQADRNQVASERDALQDVVDSIQAEARIADPAGPSPWAKLIYFPTLFRNQAASELLHALNEANAARQELLKQRTLQDPDVQNWTQRIHDVETQLRSTALTYLQGLSSQVAADDKTLAAFTKQLEQIPAKEVEQARLLRQSQALEDIYKLLNGRLQEARILEAVDDASVRVIDPAVLPAKPVKPRMLLNLILGIALGGMLGVAIAFLREYMDETVHTRDDVQGATRGAPVLGMIPRIRVVAAANGRSGAQVGGSGELAARLVTGRDPRNPVSEAYRSLRTNLTFSNPDRPPKTIVFTSPLPLDGKSTSAANLSITLAQQGINALLVDADLRRGVLHNVFGVPREPGLTTILSGQCGVSDAIREIDLGESGTLKFLPSGPFPPNPAEILGSQRMRTLVEALEEEYALIILDSAPLTVVTDAAVLGTKADGVILVARANSTEKGSLTYAVDQLRNVRAPILGCILNDVDFRRDSRYHSSYGKYGYYYQYYYADDQKRRKRKSRGAGA
jgi:capsular exopolysaccharide synthesis family protein